MLISGEFDPPPREVKWSSAVINAPVFPGHFDSVHAAKFSHVADLSVGCVVGRVDVVFVMQIVDQRRSAYPDNQNRCRRAALTQIFPRDPRVAWRAKSDQPSLVIIITSKWTHEIAILSAQTYSVRRWLRRGRRANCPM